MDLAARPPKRSADDPAKNNRPMKTPYRIFLDTAEIDEIKDAVSTGLVHGIATNSNKIARSGKSFSQVVEEIRNVFDGPIALQSVGETTEEICQCARRLNAIDPGLAIKVIANKAGLTAIKILVEEGICTNATLIYNPTQALLGTLAGSPYLSPFVGRARMVGYDGVETIRKIRQLLCAFGLQEKTNLVAASIKDVDQVIESIIAGADSVAVRFPIFEAMCEHPLTDQGMAGFMDDDRKIPQADPTHVVA